MTDGFFAPTPTAAAGAASNGSVVQPHPGSGNHARKGGGGSYHVANDPRRGGGGRRPSHRSDPRQPQQPQPHQLHQQPKTWQSPATSFLEADETHMLSSTLRRACLLRGLVESPDGTRRRKRVVRDLEGMLRAWSDSLQPNNNNSSDNNNNMNRPRLHLLSFGSYRLGVHTPDADVDCLVLAPPNGLTRREEFFGSWVDVLRKDERVKELHPVAGAYTPVMKFEMSGVKIDLLFAQQQQQWVVHPTGGIGGGALSKKSVIADGDGGSKGDSMGKKLTPKKRASEEMDEEIELDDSFLVGLDEASVRSVNGVRVAQFLLRAVGDSNEGGGSISEEVGSANGKNEEDAVRLENFRWTLRSVKEWARVNGLYSNVLGFLGGVNWAILVCWICKRNPEAPASMLLRLFFRTYATWKWPKPVSLSHTNKRPPKGVNALPVWSPRDNYRDATHLMPIITPCYPCMNSSYNVGEPQLRRIRDEFSRANLIVDGIVSHRSKSGWDDLFECNDFFRQHDRYLQVNIIGSNEDDFRAWFGLCESKMRILIAGLESPQHGVQAYPFAEFFHHKKDAETDAKTGENHPPQHIASFFIALRFAFDGSVELGPLASDFLNVVNSWEERVGGMDLTIHNVPQKRLPAIVFDRCRWQRKEEEREQKVVEAEAVLAAKTLGDQIDRKKTMSLLSRRRG